MVGSSIKPERKPKSRRIARPLLLLLLHHSTFFFGNSSEKFQGWEQNSSHVKFTRLRWNDTISLKSSTHARTHWVEEQHRGTAAYELSMTWDLAWMRSKCGQLDITKSHADVRLKSTHLISLTLSSSLTLTIPVTVIILSPTFSPCGTFINSREVYSPRPSSSQTTPFVLLQSTPTSAPSCRLFPSKLCYFPTCCIVQSAPVFLFQKHPASCFWSHCQLQT